MYLKTYQLNFPVKQQWGVEGQTHLLREEWPYSEGPKW